MNYGSGAITDGVYHLCVNVTNFHEHHNPPVGTHIKIKGEVRRNRFGTIIVQIENMSDIEILEDRVMGADELATGFRIPPEVQSQVAPAPVAQQVTSGPVVQQAAPASVVQQAASAPVVQQEAPAPVVQQEAPATVDQQEAPATVVQQVALAPIVQQVGSGPVQQVAPGPVQQAAPVLQAQSGPTIRRVLALSQVQNIAYERSYANVVSTGPLTNGKKRQKLSTGLRKKLLSTESSGPPHTQVYGKQKI